MPGQGTFILTSDERLAAELLASLPSSKIITLLEEIDRPRAVVFDHECNENDIKRVRKEYPTCFICIINPLAYDQPYYRITAFDAGKM